MVMLHIYNTFYIYYIYNEV